jgi:hypothetical protein
MERDRLLTLDSDMERLDTENAEAVVRSIVERYRNLRLARQAESPLWRWPLWQLVQDIRRQAAVHSNIIEELKRGTDVATVRKRFHDDLGLVSSDAIPNPRIRDAIERGFKKVASYGTTLVILVRDFGRELLREELEVDEQITATVQVQLALTGPNVTLGIQM